ncbi:hypothetical protein ACVWY0_000903 [Arthrobacter sp. UYNi723]
MKKITTAAAALALLAGLSGCNLLPSPRPPPDIAPATPMSVLPPENPSDYTRYYNDHASIASNLSWITSVSGVAGS